MEQRTSEPRIRGIIAIGTSTGGPRALEHVLRPLPADLEAVVTVVQHMPAKFTKSLADRLNRLCRMHVTEAEHNSRLKAGHVYLAPGNRHLTVRERGGLLYAMTDDSRPVCGHRPSVDRLFLSLKSVSSVPILLVLLTGMGRDGADGLRQLKKGGQEVATLAEAESSCVVYGMPRAAVQTGCVDQVVPVTSIAQKIEECVNRWKKRRDEL